jgi:diguanylate cyclase (GGDEF)-like protein
MEPVHRPTWLCPDPGSRERLLDMDARLQRPRAVTFAIIGLAVASAAPHLGWHPLGLLIVAVLGFRLVDGIRRRVSIPEYPLMASWCFSQVVIASAAAMSGGVTSYGMPWLLVPLVALPGRFGLRGLAAGVGFTALLVIGVAVVVEPSQPLPDIYATTSMITTLAAVSIISTALMRSDLHHRTEAVIDGLTGMLNRRALQQRLQELTAQARVTRQPIAVIAADLDHFKRINDEHGHSEGDAVLVDTAYCIRKALRAFDLAYRTGGEEFLVLLPGATTANAAAIAETLRSAVAESGRVTISCGVASAGGEGLDSARLLADADEALYEAKARGRDQVVTARTALALS